MSNGYIDYFQSNYSGDEDSLRARFTSWLKTLLIRARARYVQRINRRVEVCSLDTVPESLVSYKDTYFVLDKTRNEKLDFEEKRLAKAFSELPLMRREVLKLIYYNELKPQEIAVILGCSLQHIYNQKSLALKKLRKLMSKGGEE